MAEDTQPHPKRCPCSACLERRRARTAAASAAPGRGLERHDPLTCRCRYHVKARRVAAQAALQGVALAATGVDKGQLDKAAQSPAQLVDEAQDGQVAEEDMPPKRGASSPTARSTDQQDQTRDDEPPRCSSCGKFKLPLGYVEPDEPLFCVPSCAGYDLEPRPEREWPLERQAREREARERRAHAVLVEERQRIRNAIILEDDRTMAEHWADGRDAWQREDLEALDKFETRHALLSRPRGHSKTGDAGSEAVVELLTGKDKVMLAYAADEEQATLLLNDVKAKLRRGGYVSDVSPRTSFSKEQPEVWQPGDPIKVHIYQDRIVSTSGNVLTVEASDVSSSWGKRPDWVVCDELVEWRRPELWQAIWSATGKRPRSRVIVITTSGWDKSHFAWDVFEMARTENDWYFSSRRQCASWIQPKWLEQQKRTMPEHVYKRLHENLWVDGFGAFLSSEEVERIFTLEVPPENTGRAAIGLDVGLTHDRTVLSVVRLFPQPNRGAPLLYCDALETWQGSRSNKVDLADVQRSAYDASVQWRAPVYADPHQAEQLIQNLVKLGRVAKPYTFTSATRRDLFAGLFAAIREGRLKCAPHEELRRELLGLEVQTTASGSYRVDHKTGRYDDHVIALSLAVHGAQEREGSFHLMFGFHKEGLGPTMLFGATPSVDGYPVEFTKEIVPPTIRCKHGFDVNGSSPLENQHRSECRDGRKKHSTSVPQAPTLRAPGTELHDVRNPHSGKTERYEDRRGLERPAGPYESCTRCGKKWPLADSASRRQQHWVERQGGCSESEVARNRACQAWALPNGFTPKGPHTTA